MYVDILTLHYSTLCKYSGLVLQRVSTIHSRHGKLIATHGAVKMSNDCHASQSVVMLLTFIKFQFISCAIFTIFGRPFVKRFALCYRSVVCLSCPVCDVRALWPNGWTDRDETWHAGRPRPWPHCVRWGPSSPSPKGAQPPNFRPISVAAKWLHGSRCHLVWR